MKRIKLGYALAGAGLIGGQPPSLQAAEPYELQDITVESTRVDESQYEVPAAIGSVDQDDIQLGTQQLGLDESLNKIPGIFFQNRYNFSQDLRVSIRGFGARAAFGIRGVKIFQDGIPSTLPDGQGGVDDIDLGSAKRIEVTRSPISSLYGSSSGGAINIYTEDGPETPFIEGTIMAGEHGFNKEQVKTGGQTGNLNYFLNASHLQLDGYRDFSENELSLINSKFKYDFTPNTNLTVILNAVNSPISQDPGGVTLADAMADRRAARGLNVSVDAGEEFDQQKAGFILEHKINDNHKLRLRNYYVWKDFRNRLPLFPNGHRVEFDRFFFGGGGDYTYTDTLFGHANRTIVGFDIDKQDDDRLRWNDATAPAGSLFLDQNEEVTSYGIYVQNETALTENIELTLGLRYDDVQFDVTDNYLSDARDDSGSLSFDELTPRVSLLWSPIQAVNVYATYSTSFETPTTTELRPTSANAAGFNTGLDAQTADNYEIGVKGLLPGQISYDVAIYHIDVENELVPREDNTGWEFFENAGSSTRDGVEAAFSYQPSFIKGLTASVAYTYSNFEYDQFENFSGNAIPGVPEHQFFAELSYYHASGAYAVFDVLHVGSLYANDTNTEQVDNYNVANLRAGIDGQFGDWEISPFIGINNIFDEEYFSNIRLNAFGGRYYEAAPVRNMYAGITMRYNFGE